MDLGIKGRTAIVVRQAVDLVRLVRLLWRRRVLT